MQQAVPVEQRADTVLLGALAETAPAGVDSRSGAPPDPSSRQSIAIGSSSSSDDDQQAGNAQSPKLAISRTSPAASARPRRSCGTRKGPLLSPLLLRGDGLRAEFGRRGRSRRTQRAARDGTEALGGPAHADRGDRPKAGVAPGALTTRDPRFALADALRPAPRVGPLPSGPRVDVELGASAPRRASTLPPEPATERASTAPSGTVSRRPLGVRGTRRRRAVAFAHIELRALPVTSDECGEDRCARRR
jgi:hypothetical protein